MTTDIEKRLDKVELRTKGIYPVEAYHDIQWLIETIRTQAQRINELESQALLDMKETTELGADNQRLRDALADDALAKMAAYDCHDKDHDPRWCPTCSARFDGIDEYRDAIKAKLEETK